MPANQTPNLNLSLWEPDDEVLRTDFNADNAKIDAAVAGKFGVDNMPWTMGMYTGSGVASGDSQEIVLGFKPQLLIIVGSNGFGAAACFGETFTSISVVSSSSTSTSNITTSEIKLTDNSFLVSRNSSYGSSVNNKNATYIYFALR